MAEESGNLQKDLSTLKTQCKKLEYILEYLTSQGQEGGEEFNNDTFLEIKDAILKDFDEDDGPQPKEAKQQNPFEVKKIEELKKNLSSLENELSFLEAYEGIVAQELGQGGEEQEEEVEEEEAEEPMIQVNDDGIEVNIGGGQGGEDGNVIQAKVGGINIGVNKDGNVGFSGSF